MSCRQKSTYWKQATEQEQAFFYILKFKGPAKSFGYWGLKLLPGIRVIAEGLARRPRPEPPTHLELHPSFRRSKATELISNRV